MDNTKPLSIPVLLVYVVAQEDEEWRDELDKQLIPLRRQGRLTTWSPENAIPGRDLEQEMSAQIARASIVVLLLSPDYMASDQCYRLQQQALARALAGEDVPIIPVLVRSTDIYEQLQDRGMLPRDGQAVALSDNKDAALQEIARDIRALIEPRKLAAGTSLPGTVPDEESGRVDFLERYRAKVCSDTALTELQIPGMSDPLSVSDVYVKVHLQRQPRASSGSDERESRDPMAVFQQQRLQLEHQVGASVDPERAVKNHKYCVILGDPGAGKSMLLRHLALQLAEQNVPGLPAMPIYLKLHELAQQDTIDLFQVALTSVCGYGFPREQTESFLVQLMDQGQVLLLLDALDETVVGVTSKAAEQSYQNVIKAIQQIMKRFHALRVVVTSHKDDYFRRRQLQGFTELEVLDFLPREIEQFIRKWFQAAGEAYWQQSADALIQDLRSKPRVATLTANPLLLALIIITYRDNASGLPDNRAQLYEQCVDMLLNIWYVERNSTLQHTPIINVNNQKLLLATIAWYFHQHNLWYVPERDLLPIIDDFLAKHDMAGQSAGDLLKEISSENGLLRQQAAGYYKFLHLTIQEYFAAEYSKNEADELFKHLGDPWWEEVILLSAGGTQDAGPLLQHLVTSSGKNEIPEDIFSSKLILAGRYLAAQPMISPLYQHLRQDIPELLFNTALNCTYTVILEPLTEALAEIGRMDVNSNVNQRLIGLLSDRMITNTLKGYILLALGSYGSKTLSATLLNMFQQGEFDWIPEVTETERLPFDLLETTLGNLCDGSALVNLFAMLEDTDIFNRAYVDLVTLIGRIGGEAAVSRLVPFLERPTVDIRIRSAIPRVLGLYGTRATVAPTLVKWLVDPELARDCADGLLLLDDTSVGRHLVSVLTNKEVSVITRTYIAHLLSQLGDDSLVTPLLALFEDITMAESIKAAIASTLVTIGDEPVRTHLFELVATLRVNDQIAREIVQAFSYVGDNSLLPRLQQLENHPAFSAALKQEIGMTLGALGDQVAISRLLEALKSIRNDDWDEQFHLVASTIESIVKYGSMNQITALLHDTHYASQVRIQLIDGIPELTVARQKSLIHILINIILSRTTIESVRKAAVWVLGQSAKDQETIERLITCVPGSNIIDDIYQALWRISRRAGVRVIYDGPSRTQLRIWM